MEICKLAIKKFTNSVMERVRCFKFEGKSFAKPIPSREEVEKIVESYIGDEDKFKKCFWNRLATDMKYSSSEALFMCQPSAFAVDIIDDYLSGRDEEAAKAEGEEYTSTLDNMIENVIQNSIDIAMCRCHNLWDKEDTPNNVAFEFKGTPLCDGIRQTYGDTKAEFESACDNHFGV